LKICPERSASGAAVELRAVAESDARQLFDWQQHSDTRRYSNDRGVPTWDRHCEWLADKLADLRCLFYLIACHGRAVGTVRLDLCRRGEAAAFVVSIAMAPEAKRQGIAAAALRSIKRLVRGTPIYAEIDPENGPSRALFARSGYTQIDERWHVVKGCQTAAALT